LFIRSAHGVRRLAVRLTAPICHPEFSCGFSSVFVQMHRGNSVELPGTCAMLDLALHTPSKLE
jgi:hypothetical protein